MHSQRIGLPAKLIAALVAVFRFVALAPAAQAAPTNIVLFGDSLIANPAFNIAEVMQGPGKVTPNVATEGRCPRGAKRIASELQAQTGIKVEDFACTGAAAFAPAFLTARCALIAPASARPTLLAVASRALWPVVALTGASLPWRVCLAIADMPPRNAET